MSFREFTWLKVLKSNFLHYSISESIEQIDFKTFKKKYDKVKITEIIVLKRFNIIPATTRMNKKKKNILKENSSLNS